MKKMIFAGLLGMIAGVTQAQNYHSDQTQPIYNIGVSAGYTGLNMKSHSWFDDNAFNGAFVAVDYHSHPRASIWAEYSYMQDDFSKNEATVGYSYKVHEQNGVYVSGALGVGYAYMEDSMSDPVAGKLNVKLKYITLPVFAELGYKATPEVDVFGTLGYQWLYNRKTRICNAGECDSGKLHAVDLDGFIYKIGARYNF